MSWECTQEEHVAREKRYMALQDEIAKLNDKIDHELARGRDSTAADLMRTLLAKQKQARTLFHQIV